MLDRKLIRILGRMSQAERKEFAEFLRSPLHSHRPKLAEMVELMEDLIFQAAGSGLSNEDYYGIVYPGKEYDSNNLNRLISVIFRELKDYLAFLQYRRDHAARHVYTVREYAERKWSDMTFAGMKEARMRLDTEVPEGEDYYYQHYQIGKVEGQYWVENMPKKPGLIYQPALDRLDEFFALAKAKHLVLAINHDRIHDMQHKKGIGATVDWDGNANKMQGLMIKLFIMVYQCRANPDDEQQFSDFLKILRTEIPSYDINEVQISESPAIPKKDAELIYGMASEHCNVLRLKFGNRIIPIMNDILGEAIRKGVFLIEGKILDKLFSSQIKLLCITGYYELAIEFYENFASILAENVANLVSDYCLALIHFSKGQIQASHKLLLSLRGRLHLTKNYILANDCRVLLCMTWFHENEFESLLHEVNAFRAHLNRSTAILAPTAASYKRFCKTMHRIERTIRGKPQDIIPSLMKIKADIQPFRMHGKLFVENTINELLKEFDRA